MSKIIYYIGAGASYGKNDARELIGKGTDNERLLIHGGCNLNCVKACS